MRIFGADKTGVERTLVLVSDRDRFEWCNPMIERRRSIQETGLVDLSPGTP